MTRIILSTLDLNESPSNASVEMVSAFYGVGKDLEVEKSMSVDSASESSGDQCNPTLNAMNAATDVVSSVAKSGLDALLPMLYEVATIHGTRAPKQRS